jgi:acyl-CoA synthetase (AMP-forming)/AMP-acid ligase II/3-hydroxymyristoyl/3-hydroxydecanoyl-(acyl carrier protein) dehydratase
VSELAAAPRFIPLADLLAVGRDPRAIVAFSRGGERDWADFSGRVAALAAEIEARRASRWVLFSEDSYAFGVALFALAHAGARALIAPNRQPQTLTELAVHAEGALVDPGIGEAELARVPRLDPLGFAPLRAARFHSLDLARPLAELSTSGTTGPGKAVPKTLRHLDLEVAVHEQLFGARLGADSRVFATVSHQHLYGLLFRLLWPLASGRAFCAETFLHLEELFPRMRESRAFALATTPVHLRRMRADAELATLRPGARAFFSSGGPLEDEVARDVAERIGHAPIEIFGSSETGGVAWRQQSGASESAPWRAFPGVALAREPEEGRLVVRSPYVSQGSAAKEGEAQELAMGDRVELDVDGTFRLLGRADRIVKVGEKRLALPEMESHLRAHPWVVEAALVAFENLGDTRVGAVIALSDSGQAALAERGRRALGAVLADHLAGYWDRVLLPRAWRYVAELPRDAQGKVSRAALLELLEGGATSAPVLAPVLISERRGERLLERTLRVPTDLAFLEGHFPGRPVVAGVVQIHWVMQAARELVGSGFRVRSLEGVRFRDMLLPDQVFQLELELCADDAALRFRLFAGDGAFASGRVVLR